MTYYIKSINMQVISLLPHDKGPIAIKRGMINTSH